MSFFAKYSITPSKYMSIFNAFIFDGSLSSSCYMIKGSFWIEHGKKIGK